MPKKEIEELHSMVRAALADMKEVADKAIENIESERDDDDKFLTAIDRGIALLREVADSHQEKIADRALEIKDSADPLQGDTFADDLDFIAGGTFIIKELKSEERRINEAVSSE